MYKKFRSDSAELRALKAQCEATVAGHGRREEADELWRRIDARPAPDAGESETQRRRWPNRRRWRSVRLFISSTFKDFYAERERLVKRVFPRLRDFCRRRRLTLYECDLRWGVPADSSGSDAVLTCMRLLDRCRSEAADVGGAFFLGLVGDRFGWAPADSDLGQELMQRYNWCSGSSVTQMEFVHGALSSGSRNALFLLRDPASYEGMPERQLKEFKEASGSLAEAQVARQKLELMRRLPGQQLQSYRLRFASVVQDGRRQRPQFESLDEFEEKVVEFFQAAIRREFPDDSEAEGEQEEEEEEDSNDAHVNYMLSLTQGVQGQSRCQRLLRDFVQLDELSTTEFRLFGDSADHIPFGVPGSKAVVVVGETGCGKTTALALVGERFVDRKGFAVMAHFAQLTPASNDRRVLQRKLRGFLKSLLPPSEAAKVTEETSVSELLRPIMQIRKRILLLLDAFECFYEVSHIGELLPAVWPPNVKCIVSCRTKDLDRCFRHRGAYLYELESLQPEECAAVCRSYLDDYGKALDGDQTQLLLSKSKAANPLWLTQACEELRVFGDYAAVTQLIRDLPDDTKELLKRIAARIVKENPDGTAEALLSLVCVARVGLWETHARRLLQFAARRRDGEEQELPLADYLRLRRETRCFLRSVVRQSGAVVFRHGLSRTAVQQLLMSDTEAAKRWHSLMADYILSDGEAADELTSRDLPFHLYWCDRRQQLHAVLTDTQRYRKFSLRVSPMTTGAVYASWRCRNSKVASKAPEASLVVCRFCRNLATRNGASRADGCLYCGCVLLHNRPGAAVPAVTCQMHQAPHVNFLRCWYCDRIDAGGSQLYLCSGCSSNSNPNSCCSPIFEKDPQFRSVVRNQIKKFGLVW